MDTPGPSIYLALVLLIACSAFFSASETAISSFNKIRMRNKAEDGDKRAKTALKVAEDYDKTLSTILIGNNIVNMASASLATVMATALWGPASGPAIATFGMTVLVLIFGEILPKSFAKEHAEGFSMQVAGEVNIDDLFDELEIRVKGFDSDFSSAAGWALECLEHIPEPGESFDFKNLHVTVEQVEDKRILSLLVRVLPEPEEE